MMRNFWDRWNQFWFGPVSLYNLAVFRIVFCFTLFLMYLNRHRDVELFYTDTGILPKEISLQVLLEGFRPFAVYSFWPDSWVSWVHALYIFLLLLMALGALGRFLGLITVFLHLAFLFRNYGVAFGADQIASAFLLYLVLTRSHAKLSVLEWWRKKKGKSSLTQDMGTSIFYRMIQIQLCLIYVYSGMEKLKGMSWWDGTAVWSVLANSQMVIADFTWIRHFPLAVVFVSFTTILFEVYFPVLVWVRPLRKYFLMAGVLFHAGIGVVMALWTFAILMMSPYLLFLPESSLKAFMERLQSIWKRKLVSK